MSSTEKKEGATQKCSKCGTSLICVKIIKEWQGKKEEKLQWQNVSDRKPHFKFAGPNNYKCMIPEPIPEQNSDDFFKKRQKKLQDKSIFKKEELEKMDHELDKLIALESIVIKKLDTGNVPNPAKIGMYMKFLYDGLSEKQ